MPNFKIAGTNIKNPSTFRIERYNITNMTRIANGSMTGDLIAQKLKFYFTYDAISATDLNNILSLIWSTSSLFFVLTYLENGVSKTATVYVGSIPTELHNAKKNEWVWKNVTFNLIEK